VCPPERDSPPPPTPPNLTCQFAGKQLLARCCCYIFLFRFASMKKKNASKMRLGTYSNARKMLYSSIWTHI
jgi:hypothetical protein